jgi:hypothetical protein
MEACHFNDIPNDNNRTNLRWDTRSANQRDIVRNGNHHNASKAHCSSGHEFTSENTRIRGNGHRVCRTCKRERSRRYYLERKRLAELNQEAAA